MIDGEPWFVGKDVAESLGYSNASKAVMTHVDDDDKTFRMVDIADSQNGNMPIGQTKTALIDESGVYSLVFSSKLEGAKRFKHWVTSEVLPSIRKHGASVSSLKAENSALVGDITMWDSRALLNALIRKYAAVHMDNDFAGAWRAFYKELLYKEGISVAGRSKSGSKLNTLTEEEVIAGVSVAIAMCRRCAVDVEDIVGHADHAAAVVA